MNVTFLCDIKYEMSTSIITVLKPDQLSKACKDGSKCSVCELIGVASVKAAKSYFFFKDVFSSHYLSSLSVGKRSKRFSQFPSFMQNIFILIFWH